MDLATLRQILSRAPDATLACVGDLMVDRYVYGEVGRISPEAPIPVMTRAREAVMLGAAGNVARNIAAIGAKAVLAGVVGEDAAAADAVALIADEPRVDGRLVAEPGRATTVKTRFVAAGQQLLRVDDEQDTPLAAATEAALAAAAADAARGAQVLVLSDYAKGAVSAAAIAAAHATGLPVIVDPKGRSFAKYGPVDLIKPNARELSLTTGRPCRTDAEVEAALADALEGCEAKAILVTRAGQGMSLAVRGQPVRHVHGRPLKVFDVSGAGDTALAALGVALATGAPFETAVAFALLAAGVVVGKVGTAVATPEELIEAGTNERASGAAAKVAGLEQAVAAVARWREQGLKVGFTNGCFDVLHRGHVTYLAQARAWCDRLVVGLNSDASVRGLKGEGRPVNDADARALVLASLEAVDLVTVFDAATPAELIGALQPDLLVKGADYAVSEIAGADTVLARGGEVRLAPLVDGVSTTATLARMAGQ
jgi:D-beta-D-heptose 7-phosphate kinase/D-beta-D-heptose 1-phosphate adenosyltransferase